MAFGNQPLRHGIGILFGSYAGNDDMVRRLDGLNDRNGSCRFRFRLNGSRCGLPADFHFFHGNRGDDFFTRRLRQAGLRGFRLLSGCLLMNDNRSNNQRLLFYLLESLTGKEDSYE